MKPNQEGGNTTKLNLVDCNDSSPDQLLYQAETILPPEAFYESCKSLTSNGNENLKPSHLQRCVDPRLADCEPPPPHQRRSRVEKCCWGTACWSSRCWREPVNLWDRTQIERRTNTNIVQGGEKKKTIQISISVWAVGTSQPAPSAAADVQHLKSGKHHSGHHMQ